MLGYVGSCGVWVWGHVEIAQDSTRMQSHHDSAMQSGSSGFLCCYRGVCFSGGLGQVLTITFLLNSAMLICFVMVKEAVRIIKRTKGNESYYYLQHSFRENKKVVTKEVYLGKTIPDNIEETKQKLLQQAKQPLNQKLEKIKQTFQAEWQTIPPSAKEQTLQEIATAFTYNTNAIEGSTITLEETRLILEDQIAPNKPLRDIHETESHAATFLEMLKTPQAPSDTLVQSWHKSIFRETKPDIAGKYRNYPVRVGSHLAPDWQKIEGLMARLFRFASESELNTVEVAARAHYLFEKTHPFGDGNGRIGRLLMNCILWRGGYPMLIVDYKGRKSYYRALEGTEEGFVRYFLRKYLSVHKRYLT
jgi:fido (protein-threonine AMPylation protein)